MRTAPRWHRSLLFDPACRAGRLQDRVRVPEAADRHLDQVQALRRLHAGDRQGDDQRLHGHPVQGRPFLRTRQPHAGLPRLSVLPLYHAPTRVRRHRHLLDLRGSLLDDVQPRDRRAALRRAVHRHLREAVRQGPRRVHDLRRLLGHRAPRLLALEARDLAARPQRRAADRRAVDRQYPPRPQEGLPENEALQLR